MSRFYAVLLFLLAGILTARAAVLVGVDEPWRFTNAPAVRADSPWTTAGFDDSTWATSRSGFGYSSYGEQTLLLGAPGDWHTALFRKSFVVSNPDTLGTLVLRADYRDGFVAYLNGREIARRGLPPPASGPVPFETMPLGRLAGNAEEIRIGLARDWLTSGTNILCFQVHSVSDYERPLLVPELVTDWIRGPYLQVAATGAMTFLWKTADPIAVRFECGPESAPFNTTVELPVGTNHTCTLRGLEPGRSYQYRLTALYPEGRAVVSETFPFRALPDQGPLTLAALGDSGSGSAGQFGVARSMAQERVDLVIHAGDLLYPGFSPGIADTRLFSVYRRQMASVPFVFAWGNHDLYYGPEPMRSVLRPLTNDTPVDVHRVSGTFPDAYYSFDAGDVHVTVVFQPILSQYALTTNSPQYRWIESDLAATSKPWKMLVAHHPFTTSGGHRFTDYNANGLPDWQEFADVIIPLANRYQVQWFLSGHDHVFERFLPRNGLQGIVSGGGGTSLYGLRGYTPDSTQFFVTHHHVRMAFTSEDVTVRAVLPDRREFDAFEVRRTPLRSGIPAAAWGTPIVESGPANNADGNIGGQTFDFTPAPPLPSVTGRRSNLGRLRILLDDTHLHLGLEHAVLPADTDACIFLEIPGMPGVSRMAGLGNGIADPNGEGCDALDSLENLTFTGFQPALAAVLGDEFADGTSRSFRRPDHVQGLGQGVFQLSAGLPGIPDVRIQQFNRSPQDYVVALEQNADFMEVSIPRSALPTLSPGGVIRVGVIAAGAPDPVRQTRHLDTGWIGTSWTSDGQGSAILEGIAVVLPGDPDPDHDGLTTAEEVALGTDPMRPDSDGDGLPDGWEVRFHLNPLSSSGTDGALGDPDGDGFPNRTEMESDGDPLDPRTPEFRLGITLAGDNALRLRWPGPLGVIDLQSSLSFQGPWLSVDGFPRDSLAGREDVTVGRSTQQQLFRLQRR
jgi:hypothetical protein